MAISPNSVQKIISNIHPLTASSNNVDIKNHAYPCDSVGYLYKPISRWTGRFEGYCYLHANAYAHLMDNPEILKQAD